MEASARSFSAFSFSTSPIEAPAGSASTRSCGEEKPPASHSLAGKLLPCKGRILRKGGTMYCDRCGIPIAQGAQFCSSCGKQVGFAKGVSSQPISLTAPSEGRVRRHIQLLATLWLANGILRFVEVGSIFIAGRILPYLAGWPFSMPFANWPFDVLSFGLYSIG